MLPSIRRTLSNIGSLWSNKVLTIIFSYLITGLSTRYFGLDQMGVWLMAVNAASYIFLFDFGASTALPRVVPALHVQKKQAEIDTLLRTTYLSSWTIAIAGMLVTIFFFIFFGHIFFSPSKGAGLSQTIYILAFMLSFLGLPYRAGFGLLASVHRFDLYSWIDLASAFLKLLYVAALVYLFHGGMAAYAAGALILPLVANIVQYKIGLRLNNVDLLNGRFSKEAFLLVLSHCGPSLIITFASMLLIQGSTLLAGGMGAAYAAIFGFPLQLVVNAMSFSASIGSLLSPVASALHGVKEKDKILRVALRSIKLSSALSVILALLLLTVGPWLIKIWLGGPNVSQDDIEQMIRVMNILAVGSICLAPGNILKGIFLGTGKQWASSVIELTGSLIGVFVGWLLMGVLGGGMGLASGIVICYILRGLVLFPCLASVKIGISYWEMLIKCFLLPFGIGFFAWYVSNLAATFFSPDWPEIFQVGLNASCVFALWGIGTWFFLIDPETKKLVSDSLHQKNEVIQIQNEISRL